jgi:hypothetical protein
MQAEAPDRPGDEADEDEAELPPLEKRRVRLPRREVTHA